MPFGYSENKALCVKMMRPLNWLAKYFDKSLYDIGLLFVSTSIAVLANFVNSEYRILVIIAIGVCLLLAGLCLSKSHIDKEKLSNKNKELDSENKELDSKNKELLEKIEMIKGDFRLLNQQSIESHLKIINDAINLGVDHRISVYFEHNGLFLILGRFSNNQKFRIIHTTKFPVDKGALSKSWEQGYYEDFKCPIFSVDVNKKSANKSYYQHQKNHYGFDQKKVDSMNMKSCNYIGLHVKDNGIPIGVILFESIQNDLGANKDVICEVCDQYLNVLAKLILTGKEYENIIYLDNVQRNSPEIELFEMVGDSNV